MNTASEEFARDRGGQGQIHSLTVKGERYSDTGRSDVNDQYLVFVLGASF